MDLSFTCATAVHCFFYQAFLCHSVFLLGVTLVLPAQVNKVLGQFHCSHNCGHCLTVISLPQQKGRETPVLVGFGLKLNALLCIDSLIYHTVVSINHPYMSLISPSLIDLPHMFSMVGKDYASNFSLISLLGTEKLACNNFPNFALILDPKTVKHK